MAFENLQPYRDDILALRRPGPGQKTLIEIADYLFEKHKIRTTPATLSRFLKDLRQPPGIALREPTEQERIALDTVAILTELMAEIRGRSDEQRVAIEHLAGQVAVHTKSVEDLEKKLVAQTATSPTDVPPGLVRQIWMRALLVTMTLVGLIATGAYYVMTH